MNSRETLTSIGVNEGTRKEDDVAELNLQGVMEVMVRVKSIPVYGPVLHE
jgi:hypothetical protein